VVAHYIFRPSTICVRLLLTELGPKNPHFAKKQTNICRLSGDITTLVAFGDLFSGAKTVEKQSIERGDYNNTNGNVYSGHGGIWVFIYTPKISLSKLFMG